MEKYNNPDYRQEVKQWINSNLVNHLKREQENQTEIEHILDYLNSNKAPRRLSRMSYKEAKNGAEKWTKTLRKKGSNIIETEEDTEVVLDFKNGSKLVKLVGESAFKREGFLMSHCVASYYGKSECEVYSLRDRNGNPHCTIEVTTSNGMINQIKGKGNGSIHPKYIKYVLASLKKLGVDVRSSELSNLGYMDLNVIDKDFMSYIEETFDNVKFIIFKNKKYMYKYSKLSKKAG